MSAETHGHNEWVMQRGDLAAQISNLRVAYHKLATKYRSLAPVLRRDIRLDHALERFHCAALFQHLPSAFQTGGDGTEAGDGDEPDRSLTADEMCPVSRGWYAELVSASKALAAWPDDHYQGSSLVVIQNHITRAEYSLYHAEVLLNSIMTQLPFSHQSLSAVVMGRLWARLCEGVRAGVESAGAVEDARKESTDVPKFTMPRPPGTVLVRSWFTSEHTLSPAPAPAVWLSQLRKSAAPPSKAPRGVPTSWHSRAGEEQAMPDGGGTGGQDGDAEGRDNGGRERPAGYPFGGFPMPPPPPPSGTGASWQSGQFGSMHHPPGFPYNNTYGSYGGMPPPPPPPPFSMPYASPHGSYAPPPQQHPPPPNFGFFGPGNNPYGNGPARDQYGFVNHGRNPGQGPQHGKDTGRWSANGQFPFPNMGAGSYPEAPAVPASTLPRPQPPRGFATQIANLAKYNSRWEALEPHSSYKSIPYPSRTLNLPALDERSLHGLGAGTMMGWTAEDHIKVNASKFWAEGCGVELRISGTKKMGIIQSTNSEENVKALRKQLKMKEASRWHPDTLNRRTGSAEGGTDETIGKRKEMKGIWGALQDLLAQCEKFKD